MPTSQDPEAEYPEPPTAVESVSAAAVERGLAAGDALRLLDVRDRDEVQAWHIDGPEVTATHIPYARFLQAQVTDTVDELAEEIRGTGPITVVCGYGAASEYVAGLLLEAGLDARNLAEGMRGWARVYEVAELPTAGATVLQYRRPASGCLSYTILDGEEALVVDPLRAFVDRHIDDVTARDADIVGVLDTHIHADHVSGLRSLAAATGATRWLPEHSLDRGVTFEARGLAPGDSVTVGSRLLEARALPGHTTDMTGYAVGDTLLTGDSLFLGGVARPDLQETAEGPRGLAATLHETLTDRLGSLADETLIGPGHYARRSERAPDGTYSARLGRLRDTLPAFDLDRETFVDRVAGDFPAEPANVERIVAANIGVADVDDETAFELELGPNNCAAAVPG